MKTPREEAARDAAAHAERCRPVAVDSNTSTCGYTGESVNAYVTRLLRSAVEGRQSWKNEAVAAGRLVWRASVSAPRAGVTVSTPAGYTLTDIEIASALARASRERVIGSDTAGDLLRRYAADTSDSGPLGVIP